jgi:hypothetical protein
MVSAAPFGRATANGMEWNKMEWNGGIVRGPPWSRRAARGRLWALGAFDTKGKDFVLLRAGSAGSTMGRSDKIGTLCETRGTISTLYYYERASHRVVTLGRNPPFKGFERKTEVR